MEEIETLEEDDETVLPSRPISPPDDRRYRLGQLILALLILLGLALLGVLIYQIATYRPVLAL